MITFRIRFVIIQMIPIYCRQSPDDIDRMHCSIATDPSWIDKLWVNDEIRK